MISRGELKGRVLRFLNKTATIRGFYTDDKLNDAIQEALDLIASKMFVAGDGWMTKLVHLDTVAGQVSKPLPANIALIREIRYKVGDIYYPMVYDDQQDSASGIGSGIEQQAGRYRLLGHDIIFDPQLAAGGAGYLQIEGVYYPATIANDSDLLDTQFDRNMYHYAKYKVASILAGSLEKEVRTWGKEEQEFYDAMMLSVSRRNLKSTRIREFCP